MFVWRSRRVECRWEPSSAPASLSQWGTSWATSTPPPPSTRRRERERRGAWRSSTKNTIYCFWFNVTASIVYYVVYNSPRWEEWMIVICSREYHWVQTEPDIALNAKSNHRRKNHLKKGPRKNMKSLLGITSIVRRSLSTVTTQHRGQQMMHQDPAMKRYTFILLLC